MADTLLTGMTQDTTPATDSMVYTVDDPGGTPVDRKVTIGHLVGYIVSAAGDMIYATASRTLARLAAGSYGQVLGMNSGGTAPAWQNDDGWVPTSATWTYASATTFTITGDYSAVLVPGTKLKLTQTSVKYFRVESASYSDPTTTVTVSGGGIYTVANAAITSPNYSHAAHPQGFINALVDGWTPSSETWTYASPDTFTISGADYTSVFSIGTKLKLTQTTAKYFVVQAVSFSTNTTVTVYSPSGYSLANAAITSPYFSQADRPAGWPGFDAEHSATDMGCIRQWVMKTGIADNVATEFATITVTNESGSDDGGVYHAVFEGIAAHGSASDSAETSCMGMRGQWARAVNAAGSAGNSSAVTATATTAVAASTAATKTITTSVITVAETSEYVQSVRVTIDCAGTTVTTGEIYGWLTVYWVGFTSPPVIASIG